MNTASKAEPNVRQAVPFLHVTNIQRSLQFYVEGLGFAMTKKWTPDGTIRWCWLELGEAAIMLQDFRRDDGTAPVPTSPLGVGVSICFQCADALAIYREVTARSIEAKRPFVGNGMWVTSVTDPDGYRLDFESLTDAPEETEYSEA